MKSKSPQGRAKASLESLKALSADRGDTCVSLLSTFLDAQLIFGETELSLDRLHPLFDVYWPTSSIDDAARELVRLGLLNNNPESTYAVPRGICRPVASALEENLTDYAFQGKSGPTQFGALLDGFSKYCLSELRVTLAEGNQLTPPWGGRAYTSAGQVHYLLLRPYPLYLRTHTDAHTLTLCELPDEGITAMTDHFARSKALRQRLALYDLGRCQKINLTRSDVFVFFERYLRRVHGLRIAPAPALTQSLVDGGLLSLEMG
ncbi:MAG: hypothetical protein GTN81_12865 [Proteobacteria bacterium]|nr:hypothetical protein [Pseudomonadota bacterium]